MHPNALRTIRHGTAVANSQKIIACSKARRNRSRHRYADPRRARRHEGAGARQAPFSLPPGAAHSLFCAAKKRMGGALGQAAIAAESIWRLITAPTASKGSWAGNRTGGHIGPLLHPAGGPAKPSRLMRAEGELPRRGKRSHPGVSAPTPLPGNPANQYKSFDRKKDKRGDPFWPN